MKTRKFQIVLSALLLALVLSISGVYAQTIRVAAASNLRYVLDVIKVNFEKKYPSVKLELTLGSSGTLTQQIINGAGFHLFLSADKTFPEHLKKAGVTTSEIEIYAKGKLALWSNTTDVNKGIQVLQNPKVKRIAIAKPENAPYGARALDCMKYYKLYDIVKPKLVYAENISQAAQYAQSGNADVAIIALSLVFSPNMKGSYFELDTHSYKPVEQGAVLIKCEKGKAEAEKFLNYILSAECKPVFEKFGYIVP